MASFSDFTDFQIVLNNININNYDPRPKVAFDDFTDFQVQLQNNMVENYNVKQYNNYYLTKNVSGTHKSVSKININPKNDRTIQNILDTYSGSPGKKIFTANELQLLVNASSGNIVLTYAENLGGGIIDNADLLTNLAKIQIGTRKIIWTFIKY